MNLNRLGIARPTKPKFIKPGMLGRGVGQGLSSVLSSNSKMTSTFGTVHKSGSPEFGAGSNQGLHSMSSPDSTMDINDASLHDVENCEFDPLKRLKRQKIDKCTFGGSEQGLRSMLSHKPGSSSNGVSKGPIHHVHDSCASDYGDFTTHTVILCFGDIEYCEKNFSQDSCFLDILTMCHKLVDIYSVGIKITDEDGRPLRCDQDVTNMLKEHEGQENITIYLYRDDTARPLSYKLPQHNADLSTHSSNLPNATSTPKEAEFVLKNVSSEKVKEGGSKQGLHSLPSRDSSMDIENASSRDDDNWDLDPFKHHRRQKISKCTSKGSGQGLRSVLSHKPVSSFNGASKGRVHYVHDTHAPDYGVFTTHTVILYFGEIEYREKNFSQDSCFLDILTMCHKFVDIYSVGIKITDEDGRPLRCDQDITNMLKEHEGQENIIIYLYKDDTARPLSYKLPQHNVDLSSHSPNQPSAISTPKEVEVVEKNMSIKKAKASSGTSKQKKVRGRNKCKEVANLKKGEKLKVRFYNNRVVGKNHKVYSRHLGKTIRNRQICPLTVGSWEEIDEEKKNHMWASVTESFKGDDLLEHRDDVLKHMRELWNKWRGRMHLNYVKNKNPHEASKKIPSGVTKEDWAWLIKNYYFTPEYKEKSERGSKNRSHLTMLHRMGSKPVRQLIFEMGGEDDNPPNMDVIFYETRKKKDQLVEPETIQKYEEIREVVQADPSLSHFDVVEKCFGPQKRGHVVCYGGGVSRKDLKGPSSKKSVLEARLLSSEEENRSLKNRVGVLEDELQKIKEMLQCQGNKG